MNECFGITEVAVVVEDCYRYGKECKSEVLLREYAFECARSAGADVWLDGNGIIGALGAIPYVAMPDQLVGLSEMNVPGELG
jgi:tetrahydromethanopterin S-methyltransferase subunit A